MERADAAASHGPGAPAARPPLGLQLPPPPTQHGWGRGGAASGSQAPLGLSGRCPGLHRRPQPCLTSSFPPKASLKDGCLLAPQEFPSQGRGSALRIFPAQTDPNPPQPNRSPSFNGVLLQRPRGMKGIHWVALRILHSAGIREVPFRPRARLDRSARPHPLSSPGETTCLQITLHKVTPLPFQMQKANI